MAGEVDAPGAQHHVDSTRPDLAATMSKLGGARVILVAAAFEPIQVGVIDLLSRDARIQGWSSGTATDSTDAMTFALRHGVRPMIEKFPLQDAARALDAMSRGTVRFRAVLEPARG